MATIDLAEFRTAWTAEREAGEQVIPATDFARNAVEQYQGLEWADELNTAEKSAAVETVVRSSHDDALVNLRSLYARTFGDNGTHVLDEFLDARADAKIKVAGATERLERAQAALDQLTGTRVN